MCFKADLSHKSWTVFEVCCFDVDVEQHIGRITSSALPLDTVTPNPPMRNVAHSLVGMLE